MLTTGWVTRSSCSATVRAVSEGGSVGQLRGGGSARRATLP